MGPHRLNARKRAKRDIQEPSPQKARPVALKPQTTPPKGKKLSAAKRRRQRRAKQVVRITLALLLVGCLVAGVIFVSGFQFLKSLNHEAGAVSGLSLQELQAGVSPLTERRNVLLLGTDFSYGSGHRLASAPTRSDTMIVLSADPKDGRLTALSIPRDTRVMIGGRPEKINSALAIGGPSLAMQTVSELLGVPVTAYARLDLNGLERLVDVLGGVKVYVDKDMHYVDHTAHLDINLHQGWATLNGELAHEYVRFRHDNLGDIGRVQRQQEFLRDAAGELLSPALLFKVPQLLATLQENIQTNLQGPELMQLLVWGARLPHSHIKMVMLPGNFSGHEFQASYWLVDPAIAQATGRRLLLDDTAQESLQAAQAHLRLTVLNGSSHAGAAMAAAKQLRAAGWQVLGTGEAPSHDQARTRVIAQTGHDEWSNALSQTLGVQAETVDASVGDISSDFTIMLGDDYQTP